MCCTRPCRQPTDDGRKKASGPGRFSRESVDYLPGSRHESSQQARQLVEATSAVLTDLFPELVVGSGSLFWPNAHNRKSAQWPLPPFRQGSKRVALQKPVYLRPYLHGSLHCSWLDEVIHRGSWRPLID